MAEHLIWGSISDESSCSSKSYKLENTSKNDLLQQLQQLEAVEFKDESEGSRSEIAVSDFTPMAEPEGFGVVANRIEQMVPWLPEEEVAAIENIQRQMVSRPFKARGNSDGYVAMALPVGPINSSQRVNEQRGIDRADGMQRLSNLQVSNDLHNSGDCKPCLYLNSRTGCLNGKGCRFCHLPHLKKNRPRPCKAKRNQCKEIVNMLHTIFGKDSQEFHEASERLSCESSYMRSILGKQRRSATDEELVAALGNMSSPSMGSSSIPVRPSGELGARFGEHAAAILSGSKKPKEPEDRQGRL